MQGKIKYDLLSEVVGILANWHDGEVGMSLEVYFPNDVTYFH